VRHRSAARPSPAPERARRPFAGVRASSQLLSQDELRVRLLVEVRIACRAGRPGCRQRAAAAQVRLQGCPPGAGRAAAGRAAAVAARLRRARSARGLEQVVRLTVDVVALGLRGAERPRRLALR
jgi:hypothetical protein